MDEEAEAELTAAALVGRGGECRAEAALVLAEGALDLPALAVAFLWKVLGHLPPVLAGRPTLGRSPAPWRDYAVRAQFLPDQRVMLFGVIAGVGHHLVKRLDRKGQADEFGELDIVGMRPAVRHARGEQVAGGVAGGTELGEAALPPTAAPTVVLAGVAGLVAGGVGGHSRGAFPKQLPPTRQGQRAGQEFYEALFFRSLRSA